MLNAGNDVYIRTSLSFLSTFPERRWFKQLKAFTPLRHQLSERRLFINGIVENRNGVQW